MLCRPGGGFRPSEGRAELCRYRKGVPGAALRTIEGWARKGAWKQRLRAIEVDAARKADDELGSRRAKQLVEFQRMIEDSSVAYARQLASGDVRITASDFVGLIKAALLLQGAPAARVEVISESLGEVGCLA